jgi:sugar lactone lactonase YvrE
MRKVAALLIGLLVTAPTSFAQVLTIYAGGANTVEGVPATSVYLRDPQGIAGDAAGNLFIADLQARRLYRIDSGGTLHIRLDNLEGGSVALDAAGNAYVSDTQGLLFVPASGQPASEIARPPNSASMSAAVIEGNTMWVMLGATVGGVTRVARIDSAGTHELPIPADGWFPNGLAKDAAGNLYVSDRQKHCIYKYVGGEGNPVVIAGTGTAGFSGDGADASGAALSTPSGLVVDGAGNLLIADKSNGRVRRIDVADGRISTVVGGGVGGDGGPPIAAELRQPYGLAMSGSALFIAENGPGAHRVRKVDAGVITTVAGGVIGPGDGGPATAAQISAPGAVGFDPAGNGYFSDEMARVRRVDAATGAISTFAGVGPGGPVVGGDGDLATDISLSPASLAFDAAGNLYVSDINRGTVRKIAAGTGIVSTYAGVEGDHSEGGDGGPATSASLVGTLQNGSSGSLGGPGAIAFDPSGNLHVISGWRVRKIDAATGIISTVAGGGTNLVTPSPDGTPAIGADMLLPQRIAFDSAGNLIVESYPFQTRFASQGSRLFRVSKSTGLMTTLSTQPLMEGLALDALDNIYVAIGGVSVQRIAPDGSSFAIAGAAPSGPLRAGIFGAGTVIPFGQVIHGTLSLAIGPSGHLFVSASDAPPRVFRLTLEGPVASPPAVSFAGRLPGTTSLPQEVALTNIGVTAVTINSITPPPNFTVVSHNCAALAFGSCVVSLTFTAPSVGAFDGAVAVNASTPAQDIFVSGVGEISLVTHYYETIMRRSPDAGGKVFWDSERARMQGLGANVNETWFALSSFFYRSAEYVAFNRDPTAFVTDLYQSFFNRAPDASGLQFWADQMANGMPREVVLAQFQHSPEFKTFAQGLFGNTAARAEVDMVMDFYRGLLGRLPDSSGLAHWVDLFQQAQCQSSGADVAVASFVGSISEDFATANEYTGKNRSNAQYVGDLYNAFLRRGGELTGVLSWINGLASGAYTRKQVRDAFRMSSEFQVRVNAVVAQGCLP